jgi:hypothetical protein
MTAQTDATPNSRRSPLEHDRDMPDAAQTDAPTLQGVIHATLCDYILTNMHDADGGAGYPLIDLCTADGRSIADGRDQLFMLAEDVEEALKADAMSAAQAEIAKLRDTNRSLNRRTQQAESVAYKNAGRWKRKLERVKAFADHMLTTNMRANKREREAKADIANLRAENDRLRGIGIMPRFHGVWSATGVHIGTWDDGHIATKVLAEYPNGVMRDLIDATVYHEGQSEAQP